MLSVILLQEVSPVDLGLQASSLALKHFIVPWRVQFERWRWTYIEQSPQSSSRSLQHMVRGYTQWDPSKASPFTLSLEQQWFRVINLKPRAVTNSHPFSDHSLLFVPALNPLITIPHYHILTCSACPATIQTSDK